MWWKELSNLISDQIEKHITNRSKSEMRLMHSKPDSKYIVTVRQEITLLKARHQVTLEEKGTILVANARLVTHKKSEKQILDFTHYFL